VDLAPAVLSVARSVIAEVNPAMPRTHGESFVDLNRFDALVKVDVPVTEYLHAQTGEIAERVAPGWAASLMRRCAISEIGATSASTAMSLPTALWIWSRPA
jgi:hypothetical protein